MVLQTERYSSGGVGGGYQQQSYSAYEEYNGGIPNGQYSNFQVSHTTPYLNYQYPPQRAGWSTGDDYHGNGSSHYSGAVKPTSGGYGDSYYRNQHGHGGQPGHGRQHSHGGQYGYGSPPSHGGQHGYGSPPSHGGQHGYGSPPSHGGQHGYGGLQGYGNSHSLGGGLTNQINKLTHGLNGYGSASPNYGHSPSGFNHGNQKPSWVLKGLDDE